MTSTAAEQGLRARKKVATRRALHDAAVTLAVRDGVGRLTVEAIADEAGVSRRTFSNYFANKEEALLYGDQQRMRVLIAMVRARPAHESPWTALTSAAQEFYSRFGDTDSESAAQGRLLRAQPTLIAAQAQAYAALERDLAAAVAARLTRTDPAGVRARLTAAAFLAALRVALQIWLDENPGTRLPDLVDDALAEAGRGFQGR